MTRPTKPAEPKAGGKVRLKLPFHTRGGKKYRAGVVFTVLGTVGEYNLGVWVRGRHHWIRMKKKDFHRYAEVVAEPPTPEDS